MNGNDVGAYNPGDIAWNKAERNEKYAKGLEKRIEELESVLTELQVFLNGEGILPGVHYFGKEE